MLHGLFVLSPRYFRSIQIGSGSQGGFWSTVADEVGRGHTPGLKGYKKIGNMNQ